jgi:hypothetical protein
MSALGQKQTHAVQQRMSAKGANSGHRQLFDHVRFTPIADMCSAQAHVRYGPVADIHSSAPTKRKTPGNCPGFCLH